MYRVHIVGVSPRSGTTLLAETMAVCFDFDLSEPHERHIDRHKVCRGKYLTKSPDDLELIGPRLHFDRRLWVICLMRDPRDVIVSRHDRDRSRYWTPLILWKKNFKYIRYLEQHPRFLLLKYEDLVSNPDAIQELIQQKMPFLRKLARFSEYSEKALPSAAAIDALGGVRAISTSSIGNWRAHLPRIVGQIRKHGPISNDLFELGYESNPAWELELANIEPDQTESVHSEIPMPHLKHFWKRRLKKAYPIAALGLVCDRLRIPLL